MISERLGNAFGFALSLHKEQVRKRVDNEVDGPGIPYVAHLMSVTALVLEHGGDEEEAIAALLHDGPEDQGGRETLEEIRRRFGDRVADIVDGCSDTFRIPKPEWGDRKKRYLDHLREASPSVLLVSVADKVHNLRSILADYRRLGEKLWARFTGGKDGTLWYYGNLLEIYREKAPPKSAALVAELERTHAELLELVSAAEGSLLKDSPCA